MFWFLLYLLVLIFILELGCGRGYLLKRFEIKLDLNISGSYAKELLLMSWPLGLMFIFSQINFKADSILLSVLKLPDLGLNNIQAVGVYGLSYKIFEVMLVVPTFIMNATYPILLDSYNLNLKKFKESFLKTIYVMLGLGVGISVIGYFGVKYLITPELIEKVFTADFDISKQVLMILLTGIFIFFVTQPLSWFLVIRDKQKILPFVYGISALFNVSLNYYLIPKYSFIASSYLTWLSELVTLILLSFFTLKYWPRNAR